MSGFSDVIEQEVLKHLLKIGAGWTRPTNIYVALFTADPTDAGVTTNEVSKTNTAYDRVQCNAWNNPAADTDGSTYCTNTSNIDFAQATLDWGTITYFGLFDAQSGGNMLTSGQLVDANGSPISKVIQNTDKLQFPAGTLKVKLS